MVVTNKRSNTRYDCKGLFGLLYIIVSTNCFTYAALRTIVETSFFIHHNVPVQFDGLKLFFDSCNCTYNLLFLRKILMYFEGQIFQIASDLLKIISPGGNRE